MFLKLRKKYFLLSIILLSIGCLLLIIGKLIIGLTSEPSEDFKKFSSSSGKYSMLYPSNWKVDDLGITETASKTTNYYNSIPLPNYWVTVFRRQSIDTKLVDVENWGKQLSDQMGNTEEFRLTNQDINSIQAIVREYKQETSSIFGDEHCIDVYLLKSKSSYIFQFCSSEVKGGSIKDVFRIMIESIELN